MDPTKRNKILAGVAAVLLAIAGLITAIVVPDNGGGGSSTSTSSSADHVVTTHVDSADPGAGGDVALKAPAAAVAQVKADDTHQGSRDEQPPGVSQAEVDQAKIQQAGLARTDRLPANAGLGASDTVSGCRTSFVRNQSDRGGIAPRLFVLHETVSANRPGWSDVDAVVAWFNTTAAQASANFVIDHEGHCRYIVPLARKAWAQAGFNSVAASVEFIDTASSADGSYCGKPARTSPGCIKLRHVWRVVHRRFPAIARQRGSVAGCTVARSGIVDHHQLGTCGGGHFDITPWNPGSVTRFLLAAAKPKACSNRQIQRALNHQGARPRLTVDGQLGPASRRAIRRFRRSHALGHGDRVGKTTGWALGIKGCGKG